MPLKNIYLYIAKETGLAQDRVLKDWLLGLFNVTFTPIYILHSQLLLIMYFIVGLNHQTIIKKKINATSFWNIEIKKEVFRQPEKIELNWFGFYLAALI